MRNTYFLSIVILCIYSCSSGPFNTKTGNIDETLGDLRSHGSASALIGSYGRKTGTDSLTSNGFQRNGIGDWENVNIIEVASFDINVDNKNKLESLGLKYEELIDISASLSRTNKDKYKVVFVQIADLGKLKKSIKVRMDIDSNFSFDIKDKNSRIIITTGFVIGHKRAIELRSAINAGATLTKIKDFDVGIKASTDSTSSMSISDNTVVAYQFARACWDKAGNLRSLVIDKKGSDTGECPEGTYIYYPKP